MQDQCQIRDICDGIAQRGRCHVKRGVVLWFQLSSLRTEALTILSTCLFLDINLSHLRESTRYAHLLQVRIRPENEKIVQSSSSTVERHPLTHTGGRPSHALYLALTKYLFWLREDVYLISIPPFSHLANLRFIRKG